MIKNLFVFKNLLLFTLILFCLQTFLVASASIPWLLGHVNADDFYYYLVLARNIALGQGPTFDGLEITNGFHPLYLLLLVPLATWSFDDPAFFIRVALILL